MRSSIVGVGALACFAALACKSPPPRAPGGDEGGSATTTTAVHDAAPSPDAAPSADTLQLHERGTFFAAAVATATEQDGCIGTPDDLAACKRLDPNARCDLTPWVDAGQVYCRGAAMGPGDMGPPKPPQACACSCSAEYIKAYAAWSKRAQACSNVP